MSRYEDLDELLEHIWRYIEAAVGERDNAMTTPVVATGGPGARTVALRACNRDERALLFHTDTRSKKIEQLEANPTAVWVAWDKSLSEQLRLVGHTTVHTRDEVADAMWESEPDENLAFYYKPAAPGTETSEPDPGIDTSLVTDGIARERFAVVRTVVDEIIWLHLHEEGEYQARFRWRDGTFEGRWEVG